MVVHNTGSNPIEIVDLGSKVKVEGAKRLRIRARSAKHEARRSEATKNASAKGAKRLRMRARSPRKQSDRVALKGQYEEARLVHIK